MNRIDTFINAMLPDSDAKRNGQRVVGNETAAPAEGQSQRPSAKVSAAEASPSAADSTTGPARTAGEFLPIEPRTGPQSFRDVPWDLMCEHDYDNDQDEK